jgi:hypothetical protein
MLTGYGAGEAVTETPDIAHVIQMAVTPVFLLVGIGTMLGVMTSRLSRVIDRARVLEGRLPDAAPAIAVLIREELETLGRRAQLVSRAIAMCTSTALVVCTVIAVLFSSAFLQFDASILIAVLFVIGMLTLFFGLLSFLREIFLATSNMRIGPH